MGLSEKIAFAILVLLVGIGLAYRGALDPWNDHGLGKGVECTSFGKGAFSCSRDVPKDWQQPRKTLWLLADHHLRFDNGPELNDAQFRAELARMRRDGDCPEVRVLPDKSIPFTAVETVMSDFERLSGCRRVGWAGEAEPIK